MKVTKKHKTAIVVIERDKSLEHDNVTSGISKRTFFSSDNNSRNKKLAIHPFLTKFKTTVKKEVVSDQPINFTVKVLKSIKREAEAASKAVKKKVTWADDVDKRSDDDNEDSDVDYKDNDAGYIDDDDDYVDDDVNYIDSDGDQSLIKDENAENSDIKLTLDSDIVMISVAEKKKQMD